MASRRPLTHEEERRLLRTIRRMPPPVRALISAQWWTGFRISEVLSLTVGDVVRGGGIAGEIIVQRRHMKGRRRSRRAVILPELARALGAQMAWLRRRFELSNQLPLFPSRQRAKDGSVRPLTRDGARRILLRVCAMAGIEDDRRLGTHSLRKTFARHVLTASGNDITVVQAALQHSSLDVTSRYLEADQERVEAAVRACDFTRRPRLRLVPNAPESVHVCARRDTGDQLVFACLEAPMTADSASPSDRVAAATAAISAGIAS